MSKRSNSDTASESTATTTTPIDALAPQHATSLSEWCAQVLALRAVAKSFDADADAIMNTRIKPLLDELKLTTSVAAPTFTIVRSKGRSTLKPELLLMHGVAMSVIEKSRVTGEPSWSLKGKDDKPADNEVANQ